MRSTDLQRRGGAGDAGGGGEAAGEGAWATPARAHALAHAATATCDTHSRAASPDAARPQARALSRQQRAWLQVELAPGLSLDCGRYKWTQSQSHVEVFFPLPEHVAPRQARARLWVPCHTVPARLTPARLLPCPAKSGGCGWAPAMHSRPCGHGGADSRARQVVVELTPTGVRVELGEARPMAGPLWAGIKREDSTWTVQVRHMPCSRPATADASDGARRAGPAARGAQDGVVHLHLLKRSRRGAYADGATNADTFWPAVRRGCVAGILSLLRFTCYHIHMLSARQAWRCLDQGLHACSMRWHAHIHTHLRCLQSVAGWAAGAQEARACGAAAGQVPPGAVLPVGMGAAPGRAEHPRHRARQSPPQAHDRPLARALSKHHRCCECVSGAAARCLCAHVAHGLRCQPLQHCNLSIAVTIRHHMLSGTLQHTA